MAVGSPQRAPPAVPPAAALLYRHAVGSRPFPLRAAAPGAPPFHLTVDALGTAVRLRAVGPPLPVDPGEGIYGGGGVCLVGGLEWGPTPLAARGKVVR